MEATLEAVRRDKFGKNETVRLRRQGRIPAVLYGEKHAGRAAGRRSEGAVPHPAFKERRQHADLAQGRGRRRCARAGEGIPDRIRSKTSLLHADFYRVAMDKLLRVTVPMHLTGEAKGVKAQGGLVDFVHRDIVIECCRPTSRST